VILDKIVVLKLKEIQASKKRLPVDRLIKFAEKPRTKRSLIKALSGKKLHLICELKKASPSEGIIRRQFKPLQLAKELERSGACALSVLTETHYFKGDPKTLKLLRSRIKIPLLRKDFTLDTYQVYESAFLGADAFLIIVSLVSDWQLRTLLQAAEHSGLDALVEVHTKEELDRAVQAGSKLIGINSRNLKTLKTDLSVAERLIKQVPNGIVTVVESGIESRRDVSRFHKKGANNFLIGTSLMRSSSVVDKMNELMGR